jgi:hypothetical protein
MIGSIVLVAAAGVGYLAVPGTWSHRTDRDHELARREIAATALLAARPIDATLHVAIARMLLAENDAAGALQRANAATKLRAGAMDGWLVRSDAAAQLGDREEADASMRRALAQIHVPIGEPLVDYLVERYPSPEALAALAPREPVPWRMLVRGLEVRSADHADAVAKLRADLDPLDPEPLVYRSRIALTGGNPALALHHARLLRQVAPQLAASHLAVANALAAIGGREAEIVAALEAALADDVIEDPTERGRVEERLVRVLLAIGDEASLARAREVVPDLVARPASHEIRRGRRELAKALSDE